MDDLCLILSLVTEKFVYFEEGSFHLVPALHGKLPFNMFLSTEIATFSSKAMKKLHSKSWKYFSVFRDTCNLYIFYAYNSKYFDIGQILLMNCFEGFLNRYYLIDFPDVDIDKISFSKKFKHVITISLGFGNYRKKDLEDPQNIKIVYKHFSNFSDQYRKVRNWVAHGRVGEFPAFENPKTEEFTFFYKLETLLRMCLIEMVCNQEYKRKFDLFWQLILENSPCVMLYPDFDEII